MAKSIDGMCRVCGVHSKLTVEHILPRAAGGGEKTKIFTGDEIIKAVTRKEYSLGSKDDEKPYGIIRQNGFAEHTLCKSCNNYSGKHYDADFAQLYNAVKYFVQQHTQKQGIKTVEEQDAFFADKGMSIKLTKLKPNNIAKRALVAFCSVERAGLTDRKPEISRAIMQKDYQPDVSDFSIYLTPHIGSNGYFGTMIAFGKDGAHAYAGLEIGPLAFYLADHNAHLKGGPLAKCIDITYWLTVYDYGEEAGELEMHANFERSLMLNIPNWAFE